MIRLLYPKFWQNRNIIAYLLWLFSQIYLFLSCLRKLFAKPIKFPAKVICVGNINIGGTGKTQIVVYLARLLSKENIKFVIITKAYGSKLKEAVIVEKHHTAKDVGDESLILAQYGKVIATKKISKALELINNLKPNIIIVDDCLQNSSFYKDHVFLVVDSLRFFGNGFLIPAGPLREYPTSPLNYADLIFLVSAGDITIPDHLSPFSHQLIVAKITLQNTINKAKKYFAFSGIGNPERFLLTLKKYGLYITGHQAFPDHYNYSQKDLTNLFNKAKVLNSTLITTRKDYVKLYDLLLSNQEIICADVELTIDTKSNLIYEKIFK